MPKRNQSGSILFISLETLLVIALIALTVFSVLTLRSRNDYKTNSDAKAAAAVEAAKKAQTEELQKQFAEQEKQPNKTYKGSTTYGTVTFNYPKTWSGYVDETSSAEPINAYFHPNIVPGLQSKTAYALRVELVNTEYSQVLGVHSSRVKEGVAKASAYVPPKLLGVANVQPGIRLDGALDQNTTGSMIIVKVRDKTLQIYTMSNDFLNDFNNTVLASLTFVP